MAIQIFVNLPISDLAASMAYYKALGFDHNPQFTDETAACIVISDTIYVMVLTHEKFAQFSDLPIPDAKQQRQALYALSRENREAVDQIAETAHELLHSMETHQHPRNREEEAAKAKARSAPS